MASNLVSLSVASAPTAFASTSANKNSRKDASALTGLSSLFRATNISQLGAPAKPANVCTATDPLRQPAKPKFQPPRTTNGEAETHFSRIEISR